MKDKNGWIKLHRSILNHWLWCDKPFTKGQAWIDILMECNHTGKKINIKNEIITCERGESLNSLDTWARRWGWDKSKVRRLIKLLENDTMIELKSTRKTTHLRVINYDTYQSGRNTDESQMKHRRNTDETQMTLNKNVKNEKNNIYIPAQQKKVTQNFQKMINENYPNVAKMERQITDKELEALVERYKPEDIKATLSEMDNWKPLVKKNISVGRTLDNWLRRSYGYRTKEAVSA